jgi:hypothetical protein
MTGQAVVRRCDLDSMRAAELTFARALGPPLTPASFASLRPLRFDRAGLFGTWSSMRANEVSFVRALGPPLTPASKLASVHSGSSSVGR